MSLHFDFYQAVSQDDIRTLGGPPLPMPVRRPFCEHDLLPLQMQGYGYGTIWASEEAIKRHNDTVTLWRTEGDRDD